MQHTQTQEKETTDQTYHNHLQQENWRCDGHSCKWTCYWKKVVSEDTEQQWQGSYQWTRCTQLTPSFHELQSCIWTILDSLCSVTELTRSNSDRKRKLRVVVLHLSTAQLFSNFYTLFLCRLLKKLLLFLNNYFIKQIIFEWHTQNYLVFVNLNSVDRINIFRLNTFNIFKYKML